MLGSFSFVMSDRELLLLSLLSLATLSTQTEISQCDTSHHQAALHLHTKHSCGLVKEVVRLDIPPAEGNIMQVRLERIPDVLHVSSGE